MPTCVLSFVCMLFITSIKAQDLAQLQAALLDGTKRVQAIHHYPKKIKDGECHNVAITSITCAGNKVQVLETWSNWLGRKVTTNLVGTLEGSVMSGTWSSSYSSGSWTYDFLKGTGFWNKPKSSFDGFKEWQKLEFRIVNSSHVRDGFIKCSH